jgi:hypothetical protein
VGLFGHRRLRGGVVLPYPNWNSMGAAQQAQSTRSRTSKGLGAAKRSDNSDAPAPFDMLTPMATHSSRILWWGHVAGGSRKQGRGGKNGQ